MPKQVSYKKPRQRGKMHEEITSSKARFLNLGTTDFFFFNVSIGDSVVEFSTLLTYEGE